VWGLVKAGRYEAHAELGQAGVEFAPADDYEPWFGRVVIP
jgi:hypothetical protein